MEERKELAGWGERGREAEDSRQLLPPSLQQPFPSRLRQAGGGQKTSEYKLLLAKAPYS